MIKFAVLGLAALAIALPASADQRNYGHGSKRQPAIEVDAKVKGLLNVDADVLTTTKKSTSILDLDATVGKLGVNADLDVSKKKGIDLNLNLGKSRKGGYGGNYNDCGCEGGVGN